MGLGGGPEEVLIFSHNPDGSYTSPHGYRATMVRGADNLFHLTDHASGTIQRFNPDGYLRDVTDRNNNRITFGYAYDAVGEEFRMVSMTDTQGRVTTFERAGEYKVTKMLDRPGAPTPTLTTAPPRRPTWPATPTPAAQSPATTTPARCSG